LEQAHHHLELVRAERAQADAAADYLEEWVQGAAPCDTCQGRWISTVADLLDTTADTLRNWERNGLLKVPRDPANGYRLYGSADIGRLRVIRLLARAGYSQMAILRMLLHLDQQGSENLRSILDTPRPDEDVFTAADRWLSSLSEQEQRALDLIAQVQAMIDKHR
jgi:DNA-binding transcriptional MerR regulator